MLNPTSTCKTPLSSRVALLAALTEAGVAFKDLHTSQSSLEDIFVTLVHDNSQPAANSLASGTGARA